jgi:hypothetical protein
MHQFYENLKIHEKLVFERGSNGFGSVQFDSDKSARALCRDKITKLNFATDSFDSNHDFDLWFLIRVKHEYLQLHYGGNI